MRIPSISNFQYQIQTNKQSNARLNTFNLTPDCFITTPKTDSFKRSMPRESVSFLGGIANISNEFELRFTKTFFKKILREGITDAYSDYELISREEIDYLKTLGVLNKKSSVAIKALRKYKDSMFPVEKDIFLMLETMSKKNPDLNLQELIKLKFPQAEKSLITQQTNILNKINMVIRSLPQSEYQQVRKIIQESFNKIFEPNPSPENRFRRKDLLFALKGTEINEKVKNKIIRIAEKLPSSSDNINAFIVKYSQPYKLRYNYKTKEYIRLTRNSQELGIRLLEPSVGTDDHIYAHTKFRQEFKKWLNEENDEPLKNSLKVTILSSRKMNELKTDTDIDDFIKANKNLTYTIPNHIKRLIEIAEMWFQKGKIEDAALLSDYIVVLKNEFELRSNIIKMDIDKFEKKIPAIKTKANKIIAKKKTKSLKKHNNTDNNHKEQSVDKNGNTIENRKVQKHISRFSK